MSEYTEVLHLDNASVLSENRTILKDMHVVINAGEFCYVKGETGSGKSALINGLYGILPMRGARLYAVSQDISDLNRTSLPAYRKKIGLISDIYPLFDDFSVFKNLDTILSALDWAISSEREMRVNEVLDQLGINHLQAEKVKELTSGQRQKVAIARAVLNRPKLILADNPMVHLDSKSAAEVMELLIHLVKENMSSVLCAISDEYLIQRYPARSYFCADGTVTASR